MREYTTDVTTQAAIYTRISDDRAREELGIARQEADCRALAKRKGWHVAGVYADNDQSAYSGQPRPAYRQMLADIEARIVDGVIVYDLDRLHRSPAELESFFSACDRAQLRSLASVSGDVDLGTDDGRFHARILGAVARKESDDKSRRIRRKHEEIAAAGRNSGGGTRPFGFEDDRVTVRPNEAKLIRQAAKAVLSGDSLRSIAAAWNAQGIKSSVGKPWRSSGLRRVLTSARVAGWREHHDRFVAKAEWPAIITRDQVDKLRAFVRDPSRRTNAGARRYLLTGFAVCGLCGERLVARPRDDKRRSYVCATGVNFSGCGKIRVLADPLEELVVAMVIEALDTPKLSRVATRKGTSPKAGDLEALEADLEALAGDFGKGRIGRREWLAARQPLEARITALRGEVGVQRESALLRPFLGKSGALARAWPGLDIDKRRIIVGAVLEKVTVGPAVRGRNRFDPDRVSVEWRS